ERVHDEHTVVAQQTARGDEGAQRILGTVEMGQHAGQDGEREPVAARHSPDVTRRELEPTIVTSGLQPIV
ncbi:MAG TPA: hypothetical protein VF364_08690, partial [Candidatus Limnocylindria bacterium]